MNKICIFYVNFIDIGVNFEKNYKIIFETKKQLEKFNSRNKI